MKKWRQTILFFVVMVQLFTGTALAKTLVFAVHPFLSAIELQGRFQPFIEQLSVQSGYEITFKVSQDYETHLDNLCSGQTDLAFIGPAVYVAASHRDPGIKLLGVLNGKTPLLRGAIVVRKDSNLTELAELKGHSMAFVSPESTMGFKLACATLRTAGVSLDELAAQEFLGNHENVAFSVLAGKFDAGAIKYEVYEKMAGEGLRVLADLPQVADHPFVASSQLDVAIARKIKHILLGLHETESGRKLLRTLRSDAVVIRSVSDEEYDPLRLCTQCSESE
nr:phosphate/phosphite/phosphonate ABC transporter substrate-binding protein [uncultured Desulfuromonas sp.]